MSEVEPIQFRPRTGAGASSNPSFASATCSSAIFFTRAELDQILNLYGRKVAAGEWRDYALDFERDRAVFSVFRRTSEVPLYRIEKSPKLARRQGAYSVITATGLILKRAHDLAAVLAALEKRVRLEQDRF